MTTYIKSIIDLLVDIDTQDVIIENYQERAEKLKPAKKSSGYSRPIRPEVLGETGGCLAVAGIFSVVPILFLLVYVSRNGWDSLFIWLSLPAFVLLLPPLYNIVSYPGRKKKYLAELEKYESEQKKYAEMDAELEKEYLAEIKTWQETKNANIIYLQNNRKESAVLLSKLYAMDVIYPKYRTLPALTSIYEYLITGRCESLSGPHGAYNLYEEEVRQNTVIAQLNEVVRNLEQIRHNQYMLYRQVCDFKDTVRQIRNELTALTSISMSVAKLTAFNTFYNSCSAHHRQASGLIGLLK